MRRPGPELIDRLAAEYVLGTLRGRARDRFERWVAERADVRRVVHAWEDRLVGLVSGMPEVAPSARVWRRIELRLGIRASRGEESSRLRSRWLAIAAGIASLGIVLLVAMLARGPQVEWHESAVLASEGAPTTAWRVDVSTSGTALRMRAERPLPRAAGTDYELWALPQGGGAPVSLGLLPGAGEREVRLTERQRTALAAAAQLAVSREPAGGSPTGLPTGDVVIVAPLAPPA